MTRPFRSARTAAAVLAVVTVAVLTGCTAQPGAAPASGTTAQPASSTGFVCPTLTEVAALTAIPFTTGGTGSACSYRTASGAPITATVTVNDPAASAPTVAAVRSAAASAGTRTADAPQLAFDAFTSATKTTCTAWFPAADGAVTSVTAKRAGTSGAKACALATGVATLVGAAAGSVPSAPTVAVLAPRTLIGASTTDAAWPWLIGKAAGVRIDRLIGSGYDGVTSPSTFAREASVVPVDSTAVVFVSGTAEAGTSSLAILRAATRALSNAASRAPKAKLFVVGPVFDGSVPFVQVAALRDDLRAAAMVAGARFIDATTIEDTAGISSPDVLAALADTVAAQVAPGASAG